jgi:hypothetical protein
MIKVFISQPMRGKTEKEIKDQKESAIFKIKDYVKRNYNKDIIIIDTFFTNFDGNRLEFLGKSITDGLAIADLSVFLAGWEKADGCICENFIARQYKVKTLYINE